MAKSGLRKEAAVRPPLVLVAKGGRCRNCDRRPASVCAVLTCEELDRLDEIMISKTFRPGQTIFSEGEGLAHLFTVSQGVARAVRLLPDGRRSIVDFLAEGDFFGPTAEGRYPYAAEAVTAARLCCYPREKFAALARDIPKIETRLLAIFQSKLIASQNRAADLARKSPPEKLATFLLSLAGTPPFRDADGSIRLPMGREDIADYLGLTIETVSRTFSRFKADGLIALERRGGVRVLNAAALKALAGG